MKLRLLACTVLLAASIFAAPRSVHLRSADPSDVVPRQVLIELAPAAAAMARERVEGGGCLKGSITGVASLDAVSASIGAWLMCPVLVEPAIPDAARRTDPLARFFQVMMTEGIPVLEAIERYREHPSVLAAQPNYVYRLNLIPDDPLYPRQHAHALTGIGDAWDLSTGSPGVTIAVIGTGVQLDHPDLAPNIVPGWDFEEGDDDPTAPWYRSEDHETMVAGVAAALGGNATGVAGVCWQCRIMPLRATHFPTYSPVSANVAAAIDFARIHGARVVNMSFSHYVEPLDAADTIVETAVNDAHAAGLVLVASAGNSGGGGKTWPASLDNVIAVAATDASDRRASFSAFGSWVDVAAPGTDILTTNLASGYIAQNGTSLSASYVAGLAGLILSRSPGLSPLEVRRRIEFSVRKIPNDQRAGTGRIQPYQAVAAAGTPLFARIQSPIHQDMVFPPSVEISGIATGDGYVVDYIREGGPEWVAAGAGGPTIAGPLATIDLRGMPQGRYSLRVATRGAGETMDQDALDVHLGPPELPGWPYRAGGSIASPPAAADLDGDGLPEILFVTQQGRVHAVRHGGSALSGWPRPARVSSTAPAAGDITGDGHPEVIVATRDGGQVHAWDRRGRKLRGFPVTPGSKTGHVSVALANLDGDPALEIVVGVSSGMVHVLEGDGTGMPGWPVAVGGPLEALPAIGDLDGDGRLDVVVRSLGSLTVLRSDGTTLPGWPVAVQGLNTSPVLGDLDGDGDVEVVDAELDRAVSAYNGLGWRLFRRTVPGHIRRLSLGDVDGDGDLEIFAGENGSRLWAFDLWGRPLPGWPISEAGYCEAAPLIANLDGDASAEILQAHLGSGLSLWSGAGARVLGRIPRVDITPLVADLDGDGDVELVTAEGAVLHALDFAAPASPFGAEWPSDRADARNTGHHRFGQTRIGISACPRMVPGEATGR